MSPTCAPRASRTAPPRLRRGRRNYRQIAPSKSRSTLFSFIRTLAKLIRFQGANWGATDGRCRATQSDMVALFVQLDVSYSDVRLPPATHQRCLLSSRSRVRILPGALFEKPVQRLYSPVGCRSSRLGVCPACHVRARCCLRLKERRPGSLADRIGELPLPFVG
jgi:hypothetical protein